MLDIALFLYGLIAGCVLLMAERNQRAARPHPALVQAVGWGVMSMSSILSVLFLALAVAMAMGATGPLIEAATTTF
ncbi:hypothetical protein [Sphingomonas baiyangensis]|uniref:Uncharacterized protein n=1 Tax=Sphingomonas baiyangensis TaxID=2572576 RepID=A0A4U1L1V3_9SPHN|nr:hypothetical protein [Sphingomonas baiyangensis]TKD50464.1 hypothetical protein FBR43_06595 [Sphingomonas baiyangensis]